MTTINVKRVKSTDELKREIEDKQVEGWQLHSQSDNTAVMTKPGKLGSIWLHIALLLFTWGIGNLLYGYFSYMKTKAELRIKVE